ncbi:MAG: hypothetical protein ING32_07975 [Curvibacter sp.]|nr:hypothetical protein [Curvibacter sp.]
MTALNLSYAAYLTVSIALTVWVARSLSRSGEMFLIRCFGQDQELARSTNQLLVIGFYLVNLGLVCLRLDGWRVAGGNAVVDVVSRIGVTMLVLGLMHFFNMLLIARMGRTVENWMATRGWSMAQETPEATR